MCVYKYKCTISSSVKNVFKNSHLIYTFKSMFSNFLTKNIYLTRLLYTEGNTIFVSLVWRVYIINYVYAAKMLVFGLF